MVYGASVRMVDGSGGLRFTAKVSKAYLDELTAKGIECDFDEIEKDIIERDYRDMNREIAPLKQAEDAVVGTAVLLVHQGGGKLQTDVVVFLLFDGGNVPLAVAAKG